MTLSRRVFLGALPVMPSAARAFALTDGDADFQNVVRQIGGVSDVSPILLDAVGREFVEAYGEQARSRFTDFLSAGALDARIAQAPVDLKAQVAFVAQLLYTGEVIRNGRPIALYYPWCLAWRSLTFATAPGLCGGPAFGHWQNAPIAGAM